MVSKVDPGQVYFITYVDHASPATFHGYYKIGIVRNERETAGRIKEHQTGNPHRLVSHHVIETDAPMLIERLLHAKYGKRRVSTEWFKFKNDKERDDAIKEGQRLKKIYDPKLQALQPWYGKTPTKGTLTLKGTNLKDAEKVRDEAYKLDKEMQKMYFLMKRAEHELIALSDIHEYGIQGVTEAKITKQTTGFHFTTWKNKAPKADVTKCMKKSGVDNKFEFLYPQNKGKKGTEAYWRSVHSTESKAEIAAKGALPKHLPPVFTKTNLARSKTIEKLHREYCEYYSKHKLAQNLLEGKKIQAMILCMDHEGIDSICTWERKQKKAEPNESLMKQHFPADLLDKKYFNTKKASAKVSVYAFRPYV